MSDATVCGDATFRMTPIGKIVVPANVIAIKQISISGELKDQGRGGKLAAYLQVQIKRQNDVFVSIFKQIMRGDGIYPNYDLVYNNEAD